jgi:predicted adenylyl cyclase CyaB
MPGESSVPTNVEIKAKVADLDRLRHTVVQIASGPRETIRQEDVFFRTPRGRLKLRIFADGLGELIYYERPDTARSKQSHYQIHRTAEPLPLRHLLSAALGETVTVKKTREVYLVGQTRIHLDEVDQLGPFLELEVVLRPGQDPEEGRAIASDLMEKLQVHASDLVPCAYADLLVGRSPEGASADG